MHKGKECGECIKRFGWVMPGDRFGPRQPKSLAVHMQVCTAQYVAIRVDVLRGIVNPRKPDVAAFQGGSA